MNTPIQQKGLKLTIQVFEELHKNLIKEFRSFYQISPETLVDYQLYGFNQYDEQLPSIRKLIFEKTGKWVNGKYLYNKYREYKNNKKTIRFTREFVFIYFQTLGFTNLNDFLENSSLTEIDIQIQLNIDKSTVPNTPEQEYYVGYFVGEEGKVISTRLTLSESKQKAEWVMIYWEEENTFSEYFYEGIIRYQQSGMSFIFNNEDTLLDRNMFVAISCERQLKIKPFLVGVAAGYDRDRQPVIVEVLFQRNSSIEEQQKIIESKKLDPVIAQYLSAKRWIVKNKNPQSLFDLSVASKFANLIESFITAYQGVFLSDAGAFFSIEMSIKNAEGNTFLNILGNSYEGVFKVHDSGQLMVGHFRNSITQTPLFISLGLLPIKNKLYVGDLLGVSLTGTSFIGKLYVSNNPEINSQIPLYRNYQLDSQEVKSLPMEILNHLRNNANTMSKLFSENQEEVLNNSMVAYMEGSYSFLFLDEQQRKKLGVLQINTNGSCHLQINHLLYEGEARICEGAVLSIYFTFCNHIPHCGQIMGRIGRKTKAELTWFGATWLYLDEDFREKTKKVMIATDLDEKLKKQLYERLF